jgi:phage terminase small subunit
VQLSAEWRTLLDRIGPFRNMEHSGMVRGLGTRSALSVKHSLFVREYLVDRNATRAAVSAGYSAKSAHNQGARLMKNDEIAAEIATATTATFRRLEITRERLIEELARIAFSDISDYVEWGMRERTHVDRSGNAHTDTIARVEVIDSAAINPDARRAISEITEGGNGLKIKLHNKLDAIRLLGLELGMFKEKPTVDADFSLRAIVEAVQRNAAPLPINDPNGGRVLRVVP